MLKSKTSLKKQKCGTPQRRSIQLQVVAPINKNSKAFARIILQLTVLVSPKSAQRTSKLPKSERKRQSYDQFTIVCKDSSSFSKRLSRAKRKRLLPMGNNHSLVAMIQWKTDANASAAIKQRGKQRAIKNFFKFRNFKVCPRGAPSEVSQWKRNATSERRTLLLRSGAPL